MSTTIIKSLLMHKLIDASKALIQFVTKCVLQNPRLIIQKVVDLAQVAYADFEPTGCNRVIRKELVGQSKLKDLLDKVYGSDSVLTEGQVPINVNLNGRYDLFVNNVVVVELKNVTRLQKNHGTQIREYMSKLRCHHGVLINFPKDGATSISATRFIYEDFGVEKRLVEKSSTCNNRIVSTRNVQVAGY